MTRDGERALGMRFRFQRIRLRRLQGDFSGNAMDIGFVLTFVSCLQRNYGFADAARRFIELAEFR